MPVSWKEQMKVLHVKGQSRFDQDSVIRIREPVKVVVVSASGPFRCPFCLHEAKLGAFLISTKKGLSRSRAKCPDCGNGMLMKSLTTKRSVEEFAKWVYEYSVQGFWNKCSYNKFNDRLKKIGWDRLFWNEYKRLKGEAEPKESYHDWLERKQREQAEEEGWV